MLECNETAIEALWDRSWSEAGQLEPARDKQEKYGSQIYD
jgi:hypothetical protein